MRKESSLLVHQAFTQKGVHVPCGRLLFFKNFMDNAPNLLTFYGETCFHFYLWLKAWCGRHVMIFAHKSSIVKKTHSFTRLTHPFLDTKHCYKYNLCQKSFGHFATNLPFSLIRHIHKRFAFA